MWASQNKWPAPAPEYALAQAAVRQNTMHDIIWPFPNTLHPQAPPFELAQAAVCNLSSSNPDHDMRHTEWNSQNGLKRHCPGSTRSSDPLPTQHEINRYREEFLTDSSESDDCDDHQLDPFPSYRIPYGFGAAPARAESASGGARW